MPSTSTLVDSIYTRRVSAGECYPPDLVKSHYFYSVILAVAGAEWGGVATCVTP